MAQQTYLQQFVTDLLWGSYKETGICYKEAANLLQTCYVETGVMDFGFY